MKLLLISFVVVILTACGSKRPAFERQFYLIQPERRVEAPANPSGGTLRIGRVEVAAPFDGRPLVYRRDDVRFETDFYNAFAADPGDMLAEALTAWLSRSGNFRQVLPPTAAGPADLRLESGLAALYVDFRNEPPTAVLDVRWQLVREKDGAIVLAFEAQPRVALVQRSPAGAARACREAMEQALTSLERALAAIS